MEFCDVRVKVTRPMGDATARNRQPTSGQPRATRHGPAARPCRAHDTTLSQTVLRPIHTIARTAAMRGERAARRARSGDAAFEAAQKQKEADEKERAAEAAAGREAKTKAEKLAEAGDGHWHSKRGRGGVPLAEALSAKKLDTAVGAIGMRPFRHHIHFDDEPEETKSSLPADAEELDTAVGAIGAKPPPRGARKTPAASKKTSTRAAALSGLTSVVDKDGYECSAPASAKAKAKLGAFEDTGFRFDVFDELRAKDELFARRRIAALGAAERVAASATSARGGLLALGGAAAVAGAFAVTKRARRRVGSDAERVPLIADRV